MKHRRLFLVLAIGAAGAAAVVACSFPDVTFDTSGNEGGTPDTTPVNPADTSTSDSGSDATRDGALPPDVDPEGGAQEASVYDASGKVDAMGCTSCDCDNDDWNRDGGVVSNNGVCTGGPTSGSSAGYDCDDTDKSINPDAGFVASAMWPSAYPNTYDWNCDGVVTKQLPYGLACGILNLGGKCDAQSGFSGNPSCGETAEWITCKQGGLLGLGCSTDDSKTTTKTQACK